MTFAGWNSLLKTNAKLTLDTQELAVQRSQPQSLSTALTSNSSHNTKAGVEPLVNKMSESDSVKSHVKSKRTILYKYKAKFTQELPEKGPHVPTETIHICAIDPEQMSNALRAYHRVSNKKNNIKPDNVASKHAASPTQDKPEEVPVGPTDPAEPSKQPSYADDEKYCVCHRPYNDGELMFKCEGFCMNWYHPKCIGLQTSEIQRQQNNSNERWYCPTCCERAMGIANTQPLPKKRGN